MASTSVPAPDWVEFDPEKSDGLDFLGLRAPAQAVSNELIDGVTTQTPRLRYVCLVAWLVATYVQARLPNSRKAFERFAIGVETALTLANVSRDRRVRMVGVLTARKRLAAFAKRSLPLDALVRNFGFNIYSNASVQLGVLLERKDDASVHGLSQERGAALAEAVAPLLDAPLLKRAARDGSISTMTQSDLERLAQAFVFEDLSTKEISLLRSILMPATPRPGIERERLSTYVILLWLGRRGDLSVEDVFALAANCEPSSPSSLNDTLDGWLLYSVRDCVAVGHEFVFGAVMMSVDRQTSHRKTPPRPEQVVGELLSQTDTHQSALQQLKLLKPDEKLATLSWNEMEARVRRRCGRNESVRNGMRRWRGGLNEQDLIDLFFADRRNGAALMPIVWALGDWRVEGQEQRAKASGANQIGLDDVIRPRLERYRRENPLFTVVMEDLIYRSVDQHLLTAWNRMARDNGKDISVLSADIESWSRRASFNPGRTDSRLSIAIGWLEQLRLVRDGKTTKAGEKALESGLKALSLP